MLKILRKDSNLTLLKYLITRVCSVKNIVFPEVLIRIVLPYPCEINLFTNDSESKWRVGQVRAPNSDPNLNWAGEECSYFMLLTEVKVGRWMKGRECKEKIFQFFIPISLVNGKKKQDRFLQNHYATIRTKSAVGPFYRPPCYTTHPHITSRREITAVKRIHNILLTHF